MNLSIKSWKDYVRVYDYSIQENEKFWDAVARTHVQWRRPWSAVSDCDFKSAKVRWYLGAELNVAENCLDRHLIEKGHKKALIWVGNEPGEERIFTFRE